MAGGAIAERAVPPAAGRRRGRAAVLVLLAACASAARLPAQEEIEVVVSRGGFRPAVLKLNRGETVRLLLRSADAEHCFAVDALRVEKRIEPGRTTLLELTPERAGEHPFYCCLEPDDTRQRGKLIVAE